MDKNFQINFNSITNILILFVLVFGGFVWADTNGVWHRAEDIVPGIFGGDEIVGDFIFKNDVIFTGTLKEGLIYEIDINGTTKLNDLRSSEFNTNLANINGDLIVDNDLRLNFSCNGRLYTDIDGTIVCGVENTIPSGFVGYFNLATCPEDWSALTAAEGRFLVGVSNTSNILGTQGTAFNNLGTKGITSVPSHSHIVNPPSTTTTSNGLHNHGLDIAWGGDDVRRLQYAMGYYGAEDNTQYINSAGSHSHSVDIPSFTSSSTGVASVDVTMPYIQLLVCVKD